MKAQNELHRKILQDIHPEVKRMAWELFKIMMPEESGTAQEIARQCYGWALEMAEEIHQMNESYGEEG